mgnify:CR=1 FL=1
MPDWAALLTEQRNPASTHIDEVSTLEMLEIINREDARVASAIQRELPAIVQAAELVATTLGSGGRLLYMGAGTSGRLGILDAAECPPTYGTDPEMVQALIAGGSGAVFQAIEGVEDRREAGMLDLQQRALSSRDAVVGIAASGVTPYVLGGLEYAHSLSCGTILFTCSPSAARDVEADIKIVPRVGPEVITGSTRMKAGTATKMVLNMISTAAMIKQGKTYGNLMVDLQPKNAKLQDRSIRILTTLAHVSADEARQHLLKANWNLKVALVMVLCGLECDEADALLEKHKGIVKNAMHNHQNH